MKRDWLYVPHLNCHLPLPDGKPFEVLDVNIDLAEMEAREVEKLAENARIISKYTENYQADSEKASADFLAQLEVLAK